MPQPAGAGETSCCRWWQPAAVPQPAGAGERSFGIQSTSCLLRCCNQQTGAASLDLTNGNQTQSQPSSLWDMAADMQSSADDTSSEPMLQIQLAQATSPTGCKAGRLCDSGSLRSQPQGRHPGCLQTCMDVVGGGIDPGGIACWVGSCCPMSPAVPCVTVPCRHGPHICRHCTVGKEAQLQRVA